MRFFGKLFHHSPFLEADVKGGAHGVKRLLWRNFFGACLFCVTMVVLAKWSTGLAGWPDVLVAENGPVERMSAGAWFMTTVWCLTAGWKNSFYRIEWFGLTIFSLLFGLRELDAHLWATGWNLDKLSNYWSPRFPQWEQLFIAGFFLLMVAIGVSLGFRLWIRLKKDKNYQTPWFGQLMAGILLLMFCLLVDKVDAYYLPLLGLDGTQVIFMGIEEFGEFVLSVYAVSALWPYWQENFSPQNPDSLTL